MSRASWVDRALALEALAIYAFLWFPIVVLVLFSFNSSRQVVVWESASLHWYQVLASDAALIASLQRSLVVAFLTTVISILIGTPAALALARWSFRGKTAFSRLVDLPLIIPEIVMASSMVIFFGLVGIRLSMTTVVIAHVVFSVSYLIITVRARLAGFDVTLEEAAMDLGADEITTFFRVTLPLILPGIVSGALLVFTLSLDDYVITSFVAGVGSTTLPLQIYSMVKQGISPEINAVSTVLLALTITMVAISHVIQRRSP